MSEGHSGEPSSASDLDARTQVRVKTPAIAGIALACAFLPPVAYSVVRGLLEAAEQMPGEYRTGYEVGTLLGAALLAAPAVIVLFGANRMRQIRNWRWALASMIVLALPLPMCCLGANTVVGIWGIAVLLRPDVKRLFQRRQAGEWLPTYRGS